MLRLLRIRNFALIKELEIEFGHGLNLLTGETGSGKSILVDAFSVLLGSRTSQDMIRAECESAIIEGMFEINGGDPVCRTLTEAGFDNEEDVLLIRREISSAGKNRLFINGHLATLSLLKSIGENLADIHGQQDQKSLLDLSTHLQWLDYFGENISLVEQVKRKYREIQKTAGLLERFEADKRERIQRMEMLEYQLEDIGRIDPLPNEMEDLEKELAILSNSEKILELAQGLYSGIYENEDSVLMGIRRFRNVVDELEHFDEGWSRHRESLEECRYRLEDIALAARDYASRCDFNPQKLEQVQQRLFSLEKLVKKYCPSGKDLPAFAAECLRELEALKASADTASDLSRRFKSEIENYSSDAGRLSEKRQQDALKLEKAIKKEFTALAMPAMELQIRFHPPKEISGKSLIPACYGLNGIDRVEFFTAPNKGEEMRPLARIASGGELSRLMLAIKSLCGKGDFAKALVFDEVDSGIGGRVAEAVGKRLQSLSRNNQVFCVTHLPQVASYARNHFSVQKRELDDRTETTVRLLNREERVQEISRMLGGEVLTDTTRKHAREMLENSEKFRKREKDAV